jgi:environmental stress-induced protein Ves
VTIQYAALRADDYQRMPWKNSLGSTCEVYREPSLVGDFLWRVSLADVRVNSAFSPFPGLRRVIGTLEGAGMRLNVDGAWTGPLVQYDPFIFSGDSAVESELLDGPIRDFNLIYSPRLCAARLQWLDVARPQTFCTQAETLLVLAVGRAEVAGGEFTLSLNHLDSALLRNEGAELARIQLKPGSSEESRCCVIEINPCSH